VIYLAHQEASRGGGEASAAASSRPSVHFESAKPPHEPNLLVYYMAL